MNVEQNCKYALATVTSMGVRITPVERQSVHTTPRSSAIADLGVANRDGTWQDGHQGQHLMQVAEEFELGRGTEGKSGERAQSLHGGPQPTRAHHLLAM